MSKHAADDERTESRPFTRLAQRLTAATGSGIAAAAVLGACGLWTVIGVATRFPRWWELGATVAVSFLTLLMLVMVQHTQNHNDRATQLKLDELIRATHGATNRMMTVEDASPEDLDRIQDDFRAQAESATPRTD